MTEEMPPDLAAAVRLGGEMGRRFAEYDWHGHPLGPPSRWPAPTRSLVAVALTSRFPILLWLGREQLFLVYNDAYVPVLGDKHPTALGSPGSQVWWDVWEHIGPMLSGVVASGEATWSDDLMLPLVTEGWAQERYFTFSYSPIILDSGDVDGVFCAVAETTERVLGERRLHVLNAVAGAVMQTRSADEALAAMVRTAGGGHPDLTFIAIYLDDGTGVSRLRIASPLVRALLPDYISAAAQDTHQPEASRLVDLDSTMPGVSDVFPEPRPRQALILPIGEPGPDRSTGFLLVGLNPRRRVDGQYRAFVRLLGDQLAGALAAADSYRQQQRRAEQLAEVDRAKTAFLTNVSHEFRTPLTLLLGPLQDAIDAAGDDAAQRERLSMAHRNGQRLLRLVNSLLEFSRIEAGRAVLAPAAVDLGALTAQVASSFAGLCERAGIKLVFACDPVVAEVDPDMWETVVLNLVSNAVKFTYHGSITVTVTRPPAGGARVQVADTGTGIAQEDLARLFERFYRAGNARGRSVEGSGIGLSLVRNLIELHGGTVGLESRPGEGTTVTIELPPPRDPQAPAALPATGRHAGGNAFVAEAEQWLNHPDSVGPQRPRDAGRALVLIADDNADMRTHLDRILSRHYDTIVVADGRAALEAARAHRPDLVVTDVMMPMLDGFGLVQALRADPRLATTPVLMLSARAGAEAAGDGFHAGADDYLTKPFTSTELLHRAEARLAASARNRAQQDERQEHMRREATLADLTAAITSAESVEALLAVMLSAPVGAAAAAIGVRESDGGGDMVMHWAGAVEAELRARYHRVAVDSPVPVAHAAATGQPMVIPDTEKLAPRFDQAVRDAAPDVRSSVIHPLRNSRGTVIGVLALLWPRPRRFGPAALELYAHTARVTEQALARITTADREHRIATGFQDHLLDLDRGTTDAVIGAVYQPASEAMRVGGDWYLATPVRPGCVSVCVGDVVGHGLPAATVMGKLRAAVAATALSTPEPAAVLTTVQRYARTVPGARSASLAYAAVDTHTGTIDYLCAGHPYPLVVTPDRRVRLLTGGRLPTLAAFATDASPPADWQQPGHHPLPAGSLLVLYTDGLVERRGEPIRAGLARLTAAAAACATLPADLACRHLLRQLAPPGGYSDDVAILALRPAGQTGDSFVSVLPAAPAQLRPLRHRLGDWLSDLGLDETTYHQIMISMGEAAVNAIEHGSGMDPAKTVSVEAFADDSAITVHVSDSGRWRGDTAESRRSLRRGRGLTLMHGMSARVDTTRGRQGTTVTMRFDRPTVPGHNG